MAGVDDDDGHMIPAASIGDIDLHALARTNPAAAKEIAYLDGLMNLGEESTEQFLRLCQLLFDVGSISDSEFLLRRNLECYEGESLYSELFGTVKREEFDSAIESFGCQFAVRLSHAEDHGFLVSTFHADGGRPRSDSFRMLSYPCEVKFGYLEKDTIEADIVYLEPIHDGCEPEDYLLLSFESGAWRPMDA